MNVIDGNGDLRMAFYESSRKSILYLGEEKQRSHPMEKNRLELLLVSGAKTRDIDESLNL